VSWIGFIIAINLKNYVQFVEFLFIKHISANECDWRMLMACFSLLIANTIVKPAFQFIMFFEPERWEHIFYYMLHIRSISL
jgi:hypothetical protein